MNEKVIKENNKKRETSAPMMKRRNCSFEIAEIEIEEEIIEEALIEFSKEGIVIIRNYSDVEDFIGIRLSQLLSRFPASANRIVTVNKRLKHVIIIIWE
jgi:hypothetical protein